MGKSEILSNCTFHQFGRNMEIGKRKPKLIRSCRNSRVCSVPKEQDIESFRDNDEPYFLKGSPSVSKEMYQGTGNMEGYLNDDIDKSCKMSGFGRFKGIPESKKSGIKRKIWVLDPDGRTFLLWNRIFLFWCLVGVFVDPLFFLVPSVQMNSDNTSCVFIDTRAKSILLWVRTVTNTLYALNIIVKFRTAYVLPTSKALGKGELVTDAQMIAVAYLKSGFWLDLWAALPLLEIVLWLIAPPTTSTDTAHIATAVVATVLVQLLPRLCIIIPVTTHIIKTAGFLTKTGFAGAAYNVLLYLLIANILGTAWYMQSVERELSCWKSVCNQETRPFPCYSRYFYCATMEDNDRTKWANATVVFQNCSSNFQYGIYAEALNNNAPSSTFLQKFCYTLWWSVQQLGCFGQNLTTSIFVGENLYALFISSVGLVLFAFMIGNVQTYLQSITTRAEEWRLKGRDIRHWTRHRNLPEHLRERVRRYFHYIWHSTHGVDEQSILKDLPTDLRRDINRSLCFDLLRRVPFFAQMDDQLLDAICSRLVTSVCMQGSFIVREGDPVMEMIFIARGRVESSTTNGGFFNAITLGPGDFCGEELLSWALLPKSNLNFPTSTTTVKALIDVEAFALPAKDLKFVADQFKRLHSKKLQHTFRFHSHHWRTWAACFIQTAWRRYQKRMMAKSLSFMERSTASQMRTAVDLVKQQQDDEANNTSSSLISSDSRLRNNRGVMILASSLESNRMRAAKPREPEFSMDPGNIHQIYLQ